MSYIKLSGVSLEFPLYDPVSRSLRRTITKRIPVGGLIKEHGKQKISILALDNIDVTLEDGDRVALLGHNGAGKTSMLKLLAGFYEPTSGEIQRDGTVSALLSLTAGMDYNLSGHENIILCGMLYGLSKQEVEKKIDSISEFSELGSYLDLPVRLYSQGMILRLAFSICTSIDSDILLLDEWVGVGDQAFIQKARQRLSEIVFRSSIMVLATHSNDVAMQLCNKALFLDHGKVLFQGGIEETIEFQKSHLQN